MDSFEPTRIQIRARRQERRDKLREIMDLLKSLDEQQASAIDTRSPRIRDLDATTEETEKTSTKARPTMEELWHGNDSSGVETTYTIKHRRRLWNGQGLVE